MGTAALHCVLLLPGVSVLLLSTLKISHIVNLPGLVSHSSPCYDSISGPSRNSAAPPRCLPSNWAQGLEVAWWSVVMYPPGQYFLWEFPQTWCFCVPVTELFLSFFSFFLFLPCFPLSHSSILFLIYKPLTLRNTNASTEAVLEVSIKWWISYCIQNSFSSSNSLQLALAEYGGWG